MLLVRSLSQSSEPWKTHNSTGAYRTTPKPCGSSKSSFPSITRSSCKCLHYPLAEGPHAKEYHAAYSSNSHYEHADFVEENLAIPGLCGTLLDHLEQGDLPCSRPLPRAWRLTRGSYAGRKKGVGKRSERFELHVAVRSAATPYDLSCGETATFPRYTVVLIWQKSSGFAPNSGRRVEASFWAWSCSCCRVSGRRRTWAP